MVNLNIYIEARLDAALVTLGRSTGKKRNALIREAITEYLVRHRVGNWPDVVLHHTPNASFPPFEQSRQELLPPREDIF